MSEALYQILKENTVDNDAKAQDGIHRTFATGEKTPHNCKHRQPAGLSKVCTGAPTEINTTPSPTSTWCSINRCPHHQPSTTPSRSGSTTLASRSSATEPPSPLSPRPPQNPFLPPLPLHPYESFFPHRWYRDHIQLLVCQIFMLGCVILWFESQVLSILGIAYIIRSRLFVIWVFGFIPVVSVLHLAAWYLGAMIVHRIDGAEEWLNGQGPNRHGAGEGLEGEERWWWKRVSMGECVYWVVRVALKAGCLMVTFFASGAITGPHELDFNDG